MLEGGGWRIRALQIKISEGKKGAKRDIVLINTAACLVAAGRAKSFKEGVEIAKDSIDSGKAKEKLQSLVSFTNN